MAAPREAKDVMLECGHWVNSLGAVHVLGEGLGKLSQWCERCGDWKVILPPKKPRKKGKKNERPLF